MKKLMLMAIVVGLAMLIAAPATALEAKFSGELRMQGISHDNVNLASNAKTASYYTSRFRLKSTFEITDRISVTGQFDALDRAWGKPDDMTFSAATLADDNVAADDNIDWDTAYATIKTDFGGILVGRQWNSQWGLGIGDSTGPVDRILYLLPIENLTFVAYAQKNQEYDGDSATASDADNDKYIALVKYQGENFEAGYLQAFYNYKQFPAMRDAISYRGRIQAMRTTKSAATSGEVVYNATRAAYAGALGVTQAQLDEAIVNPYTGGVPANTGQTINAGLASVGYPSMPTVYNAYRATQNAYAGAAAAAAAGLPYASYAQAYIADPYFIAKFGGFSLKGELQYGWGTADFDGAAKDLDVDVMQYLIEAGYEVGPVSLRAGYWYMSGDNDTTDDKHESIAYIEPNKDLDIAFILTGDNDHYTADLTNSLGGGIGNFAADTLDMNATSAYRGALALAGAKMLYLGVDYKPIDTLTVGLSWANAKCDKPPGPQIYAIAREWDDDVGNEYDFKVVWKPWENLEYKFVVAYLEAGDFWKQGAANVQVDDLTTFYNALTISF